MNMRKAKMMRLQLVVILPNCLSENSYIGRSTKYPFLCQSEKKNESFERNSNVFVFDTNLFLIVNNDQMCKN